MAARLSLAIFANVTKSIFPSMAYTSNVRHNQPRSPYDQFCFDRLKLLRVRQPYYTNEMLDLYWPEGQRQIDWEFLSIEVQESFRNRPREDWIDRSPASGNSHVPLPPLDFKTTRRDFTAAEIYCEEQFELLAGETIPNRRERRTQLNRNFALLPEVQKRRLKRKAHRRNVRKAAFMTLSMERSASDFMLPATERKWIYIRPLGKGGYGRAYQMARLDNNENILENMAVKITDLFTKEASWNFQKGGPDNMLREIAYHEHLSALQPEYVVKFYHYYVDEILKSYRIYMEYCPYGDLTTLIQEYQFLKTGIPEQFLWYVIRAIAAACCAMWENLARQNGEIVHLDLNPSNVFLGFENPENFPVYPTPKVADFGLAVETDLKDRRNPDNFAYCGTRGYYAPENNLRMWDKNRHRMRMALGTAKIYGYTNIYQCGMVLYSMMVQGFGYIAAKQPGYNPPPAPPLENVKQPDRPFSDELIAIIYSCLISTPSERPTPHDLLEVIEEAIDDFAGDMAKHKNEFGDYFGRDRQYPGKLMYDVDQEKLAFIPEALAT